MIVGYIHAMIPMVMNVIVMMIFTLVVMNIRTSPSVGSGGGGGRRGW
jgi:hypothetical protein